MSLGLIKKIGTKKLVMRGGFCHPLARVVVMAIFFLDKV